MSSRNACFLIFELVFMLSIFIPASDVSAADENIKGLFLSESYEDSDLLRRGRIDELAVGTERTGELKWIHLSSMNGDIPAAGVGRQVASPQDDADSRKSCRTQLKRVDNCQGGC